MNRARRLLGSGVALCLGLSLVLAWAAPAAAHALLVSSDPARGTSVAGPPAVITLTFTEAPDPRLSTITVLDSSGKTYGAARPDPVTGHPNELAVRPGHLPNGIYTVSWRTVSTVDGHLAAGSFAFSIGVAPPTAAAGTVGGTVQTASQPLSLALAHFVLYLGLLALFGATFLAAYLGDRLETRSLGALRRLAGLAWIVAALGTTLLVGAQLVNAGLGPGDLVGTSLGQGFVLRAVPLLLTGLALLVAAARPRPGQALFEAAARPRPGLAVVALLTAATLLADALLSHAGAGAPLDVAIQWLHLLAVGAWVGGLPALLLVLRGATPETRGWTAGRFARLATVGIAAVVLTGLLRAINELGGLDDLLTTGFGQLIVAKGLLLAVLAALGSVNHFRHVPQAADSPRGLRLAARAEIVVGIVIVLLSSQLGDVPPPTETGASAPPPPTLSAEAHDFGTSLRFRLTVSPGTVGQDTFTATVSDYDSGAPVAASEVELSFNLPSRPDVGGSDLTLRPTKTPGTFSASGTNLSLEGTWNVTALVVHGLASTEVPLTLTVHPAPQVVDVDRVPGNPTIYTVHLAEGDTVQVYLDPDKPGVPNDLHATYFDAQGNGLAVTGITATVASGSGPARPVTLQILDPGHVVGHLAAPSGPQTISYTGTAPDGTVLHASLTITPGQ